MGRIKKAQTGYRADNTRVKKPVVDAARVNTTKYKYIDRPVPSGKKPTAEDSALYRRGYKRGIRGGKAGLLDNWQQIEGHREGSENRAPKQRSGGKIAPKKSNVSKKLGSAKKSIGNMRFTKKKK